MLELYIIRHGLAGKPLEDAKADEKRPLKKKGKEELREVAKRLKAENVTFDKILTSPFVRAHETAEIFNEYCGSPKKVVITDLLKPDSSYTKLLNYLNEFKKSEKVAIVGHEPFLSGFASHCLAKSKTSILTLKKGGVLLIEVDTALKPGKCRLLWLMEPRQIIYNA